MRTVRLAPLLFAVALVSTPAYETTDLKPHTLEAFLRYARLTEAEFLEQVNSEQFLRIDNPGQIEDAEEARATINDGGVYISKLETLDDGEKIEVKNGIIHDWYGAVFVEGTTLDQVLALVQNYAAHKDMFQDVEESRTLDVDGDVYDVFYRFRKKKILEVVLNTEHHVEYTKLSPTRAYSISRTTKVQEVDDPGGRDEPKDPDTGRGFMWRINSYWRFEQQDDGVFIECESISLTRDIPFALRPLISPIVRGMPKDTLTDTLESVRDVLRDAQAGDSGGSGPR